MNDLIYDALMLGRNKKVAREEYLTAIGDKEQVRFEAQEKNIRFSDVVNDTTGIIHLKITAPGYAEIEAYSEDPIISFEKKVVTTEEFKDSVLEFSFNVLAEKLHNGKNYARITFRNPVCSSSVNVLIDNSLRVGYAQTSSRRKIALLERSYIDLRLGNLFQTEWQEKTLTILNEVNGGNVADMFLMLYKANVLISCERYEEAESLMEFVSAQMRKLNERNWDLLAYYYYIGSLYEMDEEVTRDMAGRVRTIYEMHPGWIILWVLLYMDEKLSGSPKDIAEMIEGEFLIRGCNSPVMYYEAMEAFKDDPELITEPSKFVIHTLFFAAREDFLSISVASKFAEIIWHTDNRVLKYSNLDACIRILKAAYDKFKSSIILKSLCKVLICAEKKGQEYHFYYKEAVNGFLDVKGLYDYFIYSADTEKFIEIPETVLEFFAGREYELGSSRDYYFACIVKRKDEYKKYYDTALNNMIRSAYEALDKGIVNSSLAVIYRELMDSDQLAADRYARMLEILHTREISTDNPLISSVLVFHREFSEYQEAELKDGKALVRIFTGDAVVLFKDITGNLYSNIDHYSKRFMPRKEYASKCIDKSSLTRYMLVGDNLEIVHDDKDPADILRYFQTNIGKGRLRGSYEQDILRRLIVQYSKTRDDRTVDDLLLKFLDYNLEDSTRARLTEVMIDKMMYKEAYEEIRENGSEDISDAHAASLAHFLAQITDYEEDEVLEALSCRAFLNCEFDPVIFKYMCRRYDDRLDILILMYIAAKANGIDDITIAERVIRKSAALSEFPKETEGIFADYFANGSDTDLKKEFIAAAAAEHLFGTGKKTEYIFKYAESAFASGERFPDTVSVAYLMYLRLKSALDKRSIKIAGELINDLVRRGIMLEEFKEYRKYFEIPASLANTYVAEKIGSTKDDGGNEQLTKSTMFRPAPVITFELKQRSGSVRGQEAMKEIVPGIYTRNFTLFFAESVEYSIDKGKSCVITYNDLHTIDDGSRFSQLDAMIRKLHGTDEAQLKEQIKDYQKESMLMDRLF